MRTSYKTLWEILINRDITKNDLRLSTGISSSSLVNLKKGESVITDVLLKICEALDCDIKKNIFIHSGEKI